MTNLLPIPGIYKITSPTGKIYIGQSRNLAKRVAMYKGAHCHKQAKLYASLKKYGYDAHVVEAVEYCAEERLNDQEEYYIKFYNTFNTPHGLNLSSGGKAQRVSEETKLKISRSNKGGKRPKNAEINRKRCLGKPLSAETREKIRQAGFNRKHNEESKTKIGNANSGRIWSEESKEKISQFRRNNPMGDEHRAKIKAWFKSGIAHRKKVINTATGEIFDSGKIACAQTDFCYGHFKNMINGNRPNTTTYRRA